MPRGVYRRSVASLYERLARIVIDLVSGCWLWTGALDHGYGVINVDGRMRNAHRVAYELLVGPVPSGLLLDHLCHDPARCSGGFSCIHRRCINPDHLEPVTMLENFRRGCRPPSFVAAWQRAKTHCPSGHPYSGDNLFFKKSGDRACRECSRLRAADYRRRPMAAR